MIVTRWCIWGVSLLLLGCMLIFSPVQEWVIWHESTMPLGYRYIGSLYSTPSVTVDFQRLFGQIALLLVLSFCLDWAIRGWANRKDSPLSTWLISMRNILVLLLGIEILLGGWILIADPNFHIIYDTIGLLRYTVFNTWAFLYLTSDAGLSMILVTLSIDIALIILVWRFPWHNFPYKLATAYFLIRLSVGLFSVYATPYCACAIGSLTKTLIQVGALSNLVTVAISVINILLLRRLQSQVPAPQ